jgi:serine/threonine-protein kinase
VSAVEDTPWESDAYETHDVVLTDLVSTTSRATAARDGAGVRAGQEVALRVVQPRLSSRTRAVRGFLGVNERVAAIDHPHVLRVVDVTVDQGAPMVASVWRDGRALSALLLESAPLSVRDVLRLGGQVAEGLDTVHEHGVVHGTVGPLSVWIKHRPGSRVPPSAALTGFGSTYLLGQILRELDDEPASVDLLFVAPEQLRGEVAGPRTDQYALGCLLFTAVTGTTPFRGETHHSLFAAHLWDDPPSATAARDDLAPGWDDLFARALAKDPQERFENCRTLLLEAGRCARPSAAGAAQSQAQAAAQSSASSTAAARPTASGTAGPAAPTADASRTPTTDAGGTPTTDDAGHAPRRTRTPDFDVERLVSPVDEPEGRAAVAWRWISRIAIVLTLLLVVAAVVLGLSRGAFADLAAMAEGAVTAVAGADAPS